MASERNSILSIKQRRALMILSESPLLPEDFYSKMWPDGKFVDRDPGSSKGGPSRSQCAANWYLGRLKPLVTRRDYRERFNGGKWLLTERRVAQICIWSKFIAAISREARGPGRGGKQMKTKIPPSRIEVVRPSIHRRLGWRLGLDCGHEEYVVSLKRPTRTTVRCSACSDRQKVLDAAVKP